jgi:tetratricopeptide (TPR) repeat protein
MRSLSGPSLTLGAMLTLSLLPGCTQVGTLKGMKSYKGANQAYQQQDYKRAAQLYEDAIQDAPDEPKIMPSYFFLANSYDNLWKPSKKGDPANDSLLQKAVDNYQKAADKLAASDDPQNKKLSKLSLEYLVAAYGSDKMNDPAKAEPVLQKMIQQEPGDTALYGQLAKLYEDAGAYDAAENILLKAKEVKPGDSGVYMTLAGYYNRQGQFDKTIDALEQRASKDPNNPEAYYTISVFYWDKAFRDARLKEADKKDLVQKGLQAVDHALQIKPDYAEALVYKGLLLRLEATMEKDRDKQQALLKQAEQLSNKANDLRKQKAAGVSD